MPRRDPIRSALLFIVAIQGCQVWDDIAVEVRIPATFQADFAAANPDRALRVVLTLDDEPSSYGIICDLAAADELMRGKYLEEGCYTEHTFDLWAVPVRPWDTMPCGPLFELERGGDDLSEATLVGTEAIAVGKNGRCRDDREVSFEFPDSFDGAAKE